MKKYSVKEIFYSLQGEGRHAGRAAVFVRFSGCNLWNGRESDRKQSLCSFCDTDFVGTDGEHGGKYSETELVGVIDRLWPVIPLQKKEKRMVVLTGGEPLLQVDQKLLLALHEKGYYVALETNGTRVVPDEVDWVCVSPKFGARLVATRGSELKLIYPQEGIDPQGYLDLDFKHFYLQPKDDQLHNQNRERCVAYCLDHPLWKISLQIHKVLGIK